MALIPKWGREIHKMFWYVVMPVGAIWVFNKDWFRDNVHFPLMKKFLRENEFKMLLKNAHLDEEEEK